MVFHNNRVLAIATMLALLVVPGMKTSAFAGAVPVKALNAVKLTSFITRSAGQGIVSWSPDGTQIAYITRNLYVYNLASGKKKKLQLKKPYFVAWGQTQGIIVLYEKGENAMLALIEPQTHERQSIKLPLQARAAWPLANGKIVVVGSALKKQRIGPEVTHEMYIYDPASETLEKRFGTRRIFMPGAMKYNHLRSWLFSGPEPRLEGLLFAEIVAPPVAKDYLSLSIIDPLTGERTRLMRQKPTQAPDGAAWSPGGRRVAMADVSAKLRILGMDSKIISVDDTISGHYPAWNPKGSQIYFGGYLVNSDGTGKTLMIKNAKDSLAWWSPDGSSIAIVAGRKFWLIRDAVSPTILGQDNLMAGKSIIAARALRELYMEGFISSREYKERLRKLENTTIEAEE